MAEQVQATLDRMVEPLRDLQERQVFSKEEIRAVVERRRSSEYAVRRRGKVDLADYLAYIQAETQLEQLRQLRMKRLRKGMSRDAAIAKHVGDRHIVKHIHAIWSRLLQKFPRVPLFLQYAEYCTETKSHRQLARAYTTAVQLFPHSTGLWIKAASHEYFAMGSVASARVWLQRGIRLNPKAKDLWLQSFVLELHFVQKIRGRKLLLERRDDSDVEDEANDILKLPRVVYDHAVTAVDNDIGLRMNFLDACQDFPDTEALQKHIVEGIDRDFRSEPQAWIARALFASACTSNSEPPSKKPRRDHETPWDILRNAIKEVPTADMFKQAMRFVLAHDEETGAQSFLHDLLARDTAGDRPLFDDELTMEYTSVLVAKNERRDALVFLKSYIDRSKTRDARVWIEIARLDKEHAVILLERASDVVEEGSGILEVLFELAGDKLDRGLVDMQLFNRIMGLIAGSLTNQDSEDRVFGIRSVMDLCLKFLDKAIETEQTADARSIYRSVLFHSSLGEVLTEARPQEAKDLIDRAVTFERTSCDNERLRRTNLLRLLDIGSRLFEGTTVGDEFQVSMEKARRYA